MEGTSKEQSLTMIRMQFNRKDVNFKPVGIKLICSREDLWVKGVGKKPGDDYIFGRSTDMNISQTCANLDAVNYFREDKGDVFPVCFLFEHERGDLDLDVKKLYLAKQPSLNFQMMNILKILNCLGTNQQVEIQIIALVIQGRIQKNRQQVFEFYELQK
eukprot:TRINITY_DN8233_c0_g1_i2.p2 TRINITY_DN8233_c0_g1~~TRINITY_DN8233_c0_g1_i2.p2  ORF type:complete len:159 (+),score=11.40 TRINITY_DN8233_c0_g1_i2:144-620(+)